MIRTFEKVHNSVLAQIACTWEVTARKPGNVHPGAAFSDTTSDDFLQSAAVLGSAIRNQSHSLGETVLFAVRETKRQVGKNTNLGMILLLVPLAIAEGRVLREALQRVLARLSDADAKHVFDAIRLANPGGLGEVPEQDVRSEPTVTLLEAMKLAADRDLIARQYANGFADVFDFGMPAFLEGFERFGYVEAGIIHSQLRWMAQYSDSLIARKNGPEVAAEVQQRAAEVLRLGGLATPEGRAAGVALDRHLRSDGNRLNPGTTADLIAACLFVALRENKVVPSAPFRWGVPDWL